MADSYDSIERPYGDLLERSADTLVPTDEESFAVGGATGGGTSSIAPSEGNTPVDVIKNGQQLGDLYISNFIRSLDWKPKTQGFYIDGETGYAEFSNVYVASGIAVGAGGSISGGQTDYDTGTGYWLGFYALDSTYRFSIGNSVIGPKLTWDGTNLTLTGGDLITPGAGTDLSLLNFSHDIVFTSNATNQVSWAAGTITLANTVQYSIIAGATPALAAKTYVYLDTAVSTTVLQTTTVAATAAGAKKMLIAVCSAGTNQASFVVMNDQQAKFNGSSIETSSITTTQLAADSVTASKIYVSQLSSIAADLGSITAGTITGALIRTSSSGARVEIDDTTDSLEVYDSTSTRRIKLDNDELTFYNSSGTRIGYVTTPLSSSFFIGAPSGNFLVLSADGSSYAISMEVAGSSKMNVNVNGTTFSDTVQMSGQDIFGADEIGGAAGTFDFSGTIIYVDQEIDPLVNNVEDLGGPSNLWNDVYCTDLNYTNLVLNSDLELKENIIPSTYGLAKILQLSPKEFNYKKVEVDEMNVKYNKYKAKHPDLFYKKINQAKINADKIAVEKHIGFIAQEVEQVIPELVGVKKETHTKTLRQTELIPVLVKAIQELNDKIESLNNNP